MLGSIVLPVRNNVTSFTFETDNKEEMLNVTMYIKQLIDTDEISLQFPEVSNDPFYREIKASILTNVLNSFISLCYFCNDRSPRLLTFMSYDYFGKIDVCINSPEIPGDAKTIFNLFSNKSQEEIAKGKALWCGWLEFLSHEGKECIGIQIIHRYFKLMYITPISFHFISDNLTGFIVHLDQIKCIYQGR